MGNTKKSSGNGRNELLRITDKYYLGHDLYNVIVYTKIITEKGEVDFRNPRYFPGVESAIDYVFKVSEIAAVGPDIKKMVDDIRKIKDELKAFLVNFKKGSRYDQQ